jgi:hypothetical protein
MAAPTVTFKPLPASQVEQDPHAIPMVDGDSDDDMDFSATPAADIVQMGLTSLVMAANVCPEAGVSGKRTKMVHKKGELAVQGTALKLKWNVDYKAGSVVSLRGVTLKDVEAPASDGENAAAVAGGAGAGAGAGGEAGRKRARKEVELDVKKHVLKAVEALREWEKRPKRSGWLQKAYHVCLLLARDLAALLKEPT